MQRARVLLEGPRDGPVAVWLFRDLRFDDNWAIWEAARHGDFEVWVFPEYFGPEIPERAHRFLEHGVRELERDCVNRGVRFRLVSLASLPHGVSRAVVDFTPVKGFKVFMERIVAGYGGAMPSLVQVDAHNVVPCWLASDKAEIGARTMRPRLWRWAQYWRELPPRVRKRSNAPSAPIDWREWGSFFRPDPRAPFVPWMSRTARAVLSSFIRKRLHCYSEHRNDPNCNVLSGLAPWINFGFISVQRILVTLPKNADTADFIEELVVRRELADNFCYYSPDYLSVVASAPLWAKRSIDRHRDDPRPVLYPTRALEQGNTHDPLWNAAQIQLVTNGKMHSYMRMYWAKKVLEWSRDVQLALDIVVDLNDRYSLDGRDPNGYVGALWSICGVHDRPWPDRPVFGNIRSMTLSGCVRKFDIYKYIARYSAPLSSHSPTTDSKL